MILGTDSLTFQWKYEKRESNLRSMARGFGHLAGARFEEDVRHRFQNTRSRQQLVQIARIIVETDIYSVYPDTGHRTGRIERSFQSQPTAPSGTGELGGVALYSDPSTAPAKAGVSKNRFSYAAFFERPELHRFDSFIKSVNENDVVRYRPFFEHMAEEVKQYETEVVNKAVLGSIREELGVASGEE